NLASVDPLDTTEAVAVNDSGYVLIQESKVGFFQGNIGLDRAFGLLWRGGTATPITAPAPYLAVTGLNGRGQVVGTGWNAPFGAYLWEGGQTVNLQSRIDPKSEWKLSQAL